MAKAADAVVRSDATGDVACLAPATAGSEACCASECRFAVNQKTRENSEVGIVWLPKTNTYPITRLEIRLA